MTCTLRKFVHPEDKGLRSSPYFCPSSYFNTCNGRFLVLTQLISELLWIVDDRGQQVRFCLGL
jgi:hypothetical protein